MGSREGWKVSKQDELFGSPKAGTQGTSTPRRQRKRAGGHKEGSIISADGFLSASPAQGASVGKHKSSNAWLPSQERQEGREKAFCLAPCPTAPT